MAVVGAGEAAQTGDARGVESSPTLDQDVIQTFNKRFNADYPNVSKPIVCNGLREIKVYSGEPPAQSREPEPEPEPQ